MQELNKISLFKVTFLSPLLLCHIKVEATHNCHPNVLPCLFTTHVASAQDTPSALLLMHFIISSLQKGEEFKVFGVEPQNL